MASAPYDGFVVANTYGGGQYNDTKIKINDIDIAANNGGDYGRESVGEVAFRKGDKIQVIASQNEAWVCFYEKRDYTNR